MLRSYYGNIEPATFTKRWRFKEGVMACAIRIRPSCILRNGRSQMTDNAQEEVKGGTDAYAIDIFHRSFDRISQLPLWRDVLMQKLVFAEGNYPRLLCLWEVIAGQLQQVPMEFIFAAVVRPSLPYQ
ncbi:hypothetical protein Nepgr_005627 [Nepenthes gracilis]|uniref:Uncharacterized protein n=1 Tax=Nepenthes gracilis TaxID=150966 RepID=A0AAD3S3J7_NEPGR|nr:hypothetical protein Nepgr_005627 [Nepenthes gracilis]